MSGPPLRLYRGWLVPSHCPAGHPLTARRVLFGSRVGHGTRWAYCRMCGMEGSEQPGVAELTWAQEFLSDTFRARD